MFAIMVISTNGSSFPAVIFRTRKEAEEYIINSGVKFEREKGKTFIQANNGTYLEFEFRDNEKFSSRFFRWFGGEGAYGLEIEKIDFNTPMIIWDD